MALLEVRGLVKFYGRRKVVDDARKLRCPPAQARTQGVQQAELGEVAGRLRDVGPGQRVDEVVEVHKLESNTITLRSASPRSMLSMASLICSSG